MRLDALVLERYGRFRDFRLDFGGPDVRLHVIHGANEAGKSTALAAICDLLFGIETRSVYGFLHGYDAMAIGATLSNQRGATLSFRRRKGVKNTLLSADPGSSLALAEDALAPYLGGLTREAFERRFGLNHQRLREGGDQMLQADGDLDATLFQATSGLPSVITVHENLRTAADAVGSPLRKAAGKPLWQALDRYDKAQQSIRHDALREAEWIEAITAETRTAADLTLVREQLDALRQRRNRVKRQLTVLPVLARLDGLTAQAATLASAPDLPADFADRWRQTQGTVLEAEAAIQRHNDERRTLIAEAAELPAAGPLTDHSERIERLYRDSGNILKLLSDRPKLERDLQHNDSRLHEFLVRLGGGITAATVEAQRPPQPQVARIRARITNHSGLDAAHLSARAQVAAARDRAAEIAAALTAIGTPVDPAAAVAACNEGRAAEDLADRLTRAEQTLERQQKQANTLAARLSRWSGTLEALTRTAFPEAESVQGAVARQQALEALRARTTDARTTATALLQNTESEIEALQADDVPTQEALRLARAHRQRGWSLIRAGYIERTADARALAAVSYGDSATDEPGSDLPARYENAVRHADALADRREAEAQRVERYRMLQRQHADARRETERLTANLTDLDRQGETLHAQWLALWQPSGLVPGSATEMAAWLARKDEVVRAAEAVACAALEVDTLRRQTDVVRDYFRRAEQALGLNAEQALGLGAGEALGLSVEQALGLGAGEASETPTQHRNRVRSAVERARGAWDERRRLERERGKAERELERAEATENAAASELTRWAAEWAKEMPTIGLLATATPPEATAALDVWAEIEKELTDRRQRQERLRGINADLDAHEADVRRCVAGIANALPDAERTLPPLELPPFLYRHLKAAQTVETRRTALAARRVTLDHALTTAGLRHDEARRHRDHLRRSYGLEDTADPLVEARRAEERLRLLERVAEAGRDLASAGEGHSEAELRAQVQDADPDQLKAEAQAIDDDESALLKRYGDARDAAMLARQRVEGLRQRAGIAEPAQAARDAALQAGELVGRWARLTAAQTLLTTAIERFRAANEHPLLARASTLFAGIASTAPNPIERLTVEYRVESKKDKQVLVGVRRDESRVTIGGMSDGTRDQLYLALRIAAIATAADNGEPMPFIADDLFITSDDERTAPGLKALAELGAHTQVLLFTHHRSVVEAARSVIPAAALRLHTLAAMP